MNNARRNKLKSAISYIQMASDVVDAALSEEEYCMDNIPENLQESSRFQKAEDAVDALEDALDYLDSARKSLEESME